MKNFVKKAMVAVMVLLPCFQTNTWAMGEPEDVPLFPDPTTNQGGGPRARARARYIVEPICTYFEGEVTIEAGNGITFINAQIVRAEDNVTWSDTCVGDTLIMSVTDEPGTYYLTITLSNGKSYIGKYYIE